MCVREGKKKRREIEEKGRGKDRENVREEEGEFHCLVSEVQHFVHYRFVGLV